MEINTIEDQLQLIDIAFSEARHHPNPIGIDGLPYFRQANRWWVSEDDQEKAVAQFTDVHSADDEPLAVAALVAHVKDRLIMSVTSDTNSVLLRVLVQFETRQAANMDPDKVVKDRYLAELQWVMPLPDGLIITPDAPEAPEVEAEPSPLDLVPSFVPAPFIPEGIPGLTPRAGSPPVISLGDEELL